MRSSDNRADQMEIVLRCLPDFVQNLVTCTRERCCSWLEVINGVLRVADNEMRDALDRTLDCEFYFLDKMQQILKLAAIYLYYKGAEKYISAINETKFIWNLNWFVYSVYWL